MKYLISFTLFLTAYALIDYALALSFWKRMALVLAIMLINFTYQIL